MSTMGNQFLNIDSGSALSYQEEERSRHRPAYDVYISLTPEAVSSKSYKEIYL